MSLNFMPGFGSVTVSARPETVWGEVNRASSKRRWATATLSMWTKVWIMLEIQLFCVSYAWLERLGVLPRQSCSILSRTEVEILSDCQVEEISIHSASRSNAASSELLSIVGF